MIVQNRMKQKNFWEILTVLTVRHIQVKYKQTFFGVIWAVFLPIVIVMAGVFVRTGIYFVSKGAVELTRIESVAVKSLPWAFFVGALKFTVNSLVSNMGILKKIYFPRIIFPLSYILSSLFDLFVAAIAFGILLAIFFHIGISWYILWAPFLLLVMVCYTAGWGIILSCANLFYRDVRLIIDIFLTFAIFVTPVYYNAGLFGKWKFIVMLNPVASVLEALNDVIVLHQPPEYLWVLYATVWACFIFILGWKTFRKFEPFFADRV